MREITFERKALYEEVWETPMTRLAKKYGLSDNGLRKICEALNIPLPSSGHWAKVAAGHKIKRIPLPTDAARTTFVSRPGEYEQGVGLAEDEAWLAERIAFEQQEEHTISVEEKPTRWHKALMPIREGLRESMREMREARRDFERGEKNPRLRQLPGWRGGYWRLFADKGEILSQTHKSSPTRVSPLTYERALAIINALCREAERRGFSVALNEDSGRIELKGHEGTVAVRITERLEAKSRVEQNEWDKKSREVQYKVPTGKLRLYVGERWSESDISDDDERNIEAKLNAAFIRIYRTIVNQREVRRRRAAQEREWKIEAAKREAAETRRLEQLALEEKERRHQRALVIEAKRWKSAELIREYVAHVARLKHAELSGLADWSTWANGVANALDPTAHRMTQLHAANGINAIAADDSV
jgi:hypothetical protein